MRPPTRTGPPDGRSNKDPGARDSSSHRRSCKQIGTALRQEETRNQPSRKNPGAHNSGHYPCCCCERYLFNRHTGSTVGLTE